MGATYEGQTKKLKRFGGSASEKCALPAKLDRKKFQLECLGASTGVCTATGMFARSIVHSSFKSAPHPSSKGSGRGGGVKAKGKNNLQEKGVFHCFLLNAVK